MKKIAVVVAVLVGLATPGASAAGKDDAAKIELSSILKLGTFATACSAAQVRALLDRDSTFDINAYPVTLTPVQLAMNRLLKAITNKDIAYQNACLATISAIISDDRYRWQETGSRQNTDLTYFLRNTKGVAGDNDALNGYRTATFVLLDLLKRKTDFDINYRLQAPHGPTHVATAAGAIAAGGLPETWCNVTDILSGVDLEARPDDRFYTPLLIAISNKRSEMVRLLIGEGADYLVHVDGVAGNAARTIAANVGAKDIEAFLIAHQQGTQLGVACDRKST